MEMQYNIKVELGGVTEAYTLDYLSVLGWGS